LTKNQTNILTKIAENPKVTLTELSELLGLHRTSIAENTSKLQKLGVLKRVGSDKTGYWEIKK
jgi:predicted HTH transcriptional regulator